MDITRDAITERLHVLQTSKEQLTANLNATEGAIQDCQYWLARLDAADTADETAPAVTE
jgi:hypothetical protein